MAWVDSGVALGEIGTILQMREDLCYIVNYVNSLSHFPVIGRLGRHSSQLLQANSRRERFRAHPCLILGVLFPLEGWDVERGTERMEA